MLLLLFGIAAMCLPCWSKLSEDSEGHMITPNQHRVLKHQKKRGLYSGCFGFANSCCVEELVLPFQYVSPNWQGLCCKCYLSAACAKEFKAWVSHPRRMIQEENKALFCHYQWFSCFSSLALLTCCTLRSLCVAQNCCRGLEYGQPMWGLQATLFEVWQVLTQSPLPCAVAAVPAFFWVCFGTLNQSAVAVFGCTKFLIFAGYDENALVDADLDMEEFPEEDLDSEGDLDSPDSDSDLGKQGKEPDSEDLEQASPPADADEPVSEKIKKDYWLYNSCEPPSYITRGSNSSSCDKQDCCESGCECAKKV